MIRKFKVLEHHLEQIMIDRRSLKILVLLSKTKKMQVYKPGSVS